MFNCNVVDENRRLVAPLKPVAFDGDVKDLGGVFPGAIAMTLGGSRWRFPIGIVV